MKDIAAVFRSPKIVLMTLFAFVTLSLAACGPSAGGETEDSGTATESTTTSGGG